MKKLIAIVLAITFYGGYRLGVGTQDRWTMTYMLETEKFHIADRSAVAIIEFDKMAPLVENDKALMCKMRQSVIRQSEDWINCKASSVCAKQAQGLIEGFYAQVDGIISKFKALSCD